MPPGLKLRITGIGELPIYNFDVQEKGFPAPATKLRDENPRGGRAALRLPEYNWSVGAPLKNAIDWMSRFQPQPFNNKPAAGSAAPRARWEVPGANTTCAQSSQLGVHWLVKPECFHRQLGEQVHRRKADRRDHAQVPLRRDARARRLDQARQAPRSRERKTMSYKLLSFKSGGEGRTGLLVGEQVYDAARVTGKPGLGHGARRACRIGRRRTRVRRLSRSASPPGKEQKKEQRPALKRPKLLAPVLYPGNIYCAGPTTPTTMAEMAPRAGQGARTDDEGPGEKPGHFRQDLEELGGRARVRK